MTEPIQQPLQQTSDQEVVLTHAEAMALLTWLHELHLQVPVASEPNLHSAFNKLQAARAYREAQLSKGAGRSFKLNSRDK